MFQISLFLHVCLCISFLLLLFCVGVCVSFNIPKPSQLFAARSPVRHEGHTQTHAHIRASAHKFPLSAGGQGKVVGGERGRRRVFGPQTVCASIGQTKNGAAERAIGRKKKKDFIKQMIFGATAWRKFRIFLLSIPFFPGPPMLRSPS